MNHSPEISDVLVSCNSVIPTFVELVSPRLLIRTRTVCKNL